MALALPRSLKSQTSAAASTSTSAAASEQEPGTQPTGWAGFAQVQSSGANLGTGIIIDADVGYNFTEHFGGDVGVPIILTRSPFSPVSNHDYFWTGLLGEPYLDVRYTSIYHDLNYTSVLTGTIPASDQNSIFSTGRFGVDWFNHVDEPFGPVTPFLNFGASNGAVNRFVMPRPYSSARLYESLGFLADVEGGAEYKRTSGIAKNIGIGASFYALVPAGPQKVFSRLVVPYSSLAGDGQHDRFFDSTFETKGPSKVARDNGYSAWIDLARWHSVDFQLGYTHSVHYSLDTYTLTITFDARALLTGLSGR
jgi:hypothetical protein